MSVLENSLAPPTRFDLNFRLGDIPVRVHPFFWLSALFLSLTGEGQNVQQKALLVVISIAVVFVSILVHELGHVLMGRYFGSRGQILLTGFCGLAIGSSELPERWQRNCVYLAGPAAGFLFAALTAGGLWLYDPDLTLSLLGGLIGEPYFLVLPLPIQHALWTLLWVNIFWGVLNLLPIWPLDGGQVSREICQHYRGRDGVRLSLVISLCTALALAILAVIELARKEPLIKYIRFGESLFSVLFFALLALTSWQLLQVVRRVGPDWEHEDQEPRAPWEQDADWWKAGRNPWED